MSILAIILLALGLIVVLILVVASFSSNEYSIERAITINKPKHDVFGFIMLLKNQDLYNKWVMTDPGMKKEYRGIDGTVGFVYAWDSNNKQVGKGEQEIKNIVEDERLDCEVRFIKPFEGVAKVTMITEFATGNNTKLKWVFSGLRNYPMKIMHLVLNLQKMLAKDLETSLNNLKKVLEG